MRLTENQRGVMLAASLALVGFSTQIPPNTAPVWLPQIMVLAGIAGGLLQKLLQQDNTQPNTIMQDIQPIITGFLNLTPTEQQALIVLIPKLGDLLKPVEPVKPT